MPNIVITLLTSKRTRQIIDALDVSVVAQPGGYSVIEGEDNATEIKVVYPEAYVFGNCYVYMKNARGEHLLKMLDKAEELYKSEKTFTLPASMTFAGNTSLVFYAIDGDSKTVWSPVIVPIAATGVDYKKAAMASSDLLYEAVAKAQEALDAVKVFRNLGLPEPSAENEGKTVIITKTGYAALEIERYITQSDGGTVAVSLDRNTDVTLSAENLASITVSLTDSNNISHGYVAGLNFVANDDTTLTINNTTNYEVILLQGGQRVSAFELISGEIIKLVVSCDGLYIYCNLTEI